MGLNLGLALIQNMKQELRMTPQLQMAIRHLQLSRVDLIEEIQRELMSNPLLKKLIILRFCYTKNSMVSEEMDSGRRERLRGREQRVRTRYLKMVLGQVKKV